MLSIQFVKLMSLPSRTWRFLNLAVELLMRTREQKELFLEFFGSTCFLDFAPQHPQSIHPLQHFCLLTKFPKHQSLLTNFVIFETPTSTAITLICLNQDLFPSIITLLTQCHKLIGIPKLSLPNFKKLSP